MKRNITINLYGTLYAIDEDAYELLDKYLKNMRGYFGRREGGDEIADDIERRVAELFAELSTDGVQAITEAHVRGIISRIGNPEDMDTADGTGGNVGGGMPGDGDGGGNGTGTRRTESVGAEALHRAGDWMKGRSLYRDADNQMVGGVIAGVCKYFGATDPLPWRILFVLLCCVTFTVPALLYLLLWAFVPQARTVEEKLRMRGAPVSPDTLNEELMGAAGRGGGAGAAVGVARSFAGTLLSLAVLVFKLFMLVLCVLPTIALVVYTVFLACVTFGTADITTFMGEDGGAALTAARASAATMWMLWGVALTGFVALGIALFSILRWIVKSASDKCLSVSTKMALAALFVVSLISCLTLGTLAAAQVNRDCRHLNTYNGVYIQYSQKKRLDGDNWAIAEARNCNEDGRFLCHADIHAGGQEVYDVEGVRADKDDYHMPAFLKACRTNDFPAGYYHMEALVNAPGAASLTFFAETSDSRSIASFASAREVAKGLLVQSDSLTAARKGFYPLSVGWADNVGLCSDWQSVCAYGLCEADDRLACLRTGSFRLSGGKTRYGFSASLPAGVSRIEVVSLWLVPDSVAAVR